MATGSKAVSATEKGKQVELKIPVLTMMKVAAFALVLVCVVKLWPFLMLLFLAVLLAVTLSPVAGWIERKGASHGVAVLIVAVTLVGAIIAACALLGPPLSRQVGEIAGDYEGFRQKATARIPEGSPMGHLVRWIFAVPTMPEVKEIVTSKPIAWGVAAGEAISGFAMALVLCCYLLYDGKRLYAWMLAYVPRRHRDKAARTVPEVSQVVLAYVAGQVLTSVLVAIFSGIVLTVFKVPAAIPLAILAGICDVLPFIGVVLFTIPAVLFAFTVSPTAAYSVFGLFVAYHVLENYYIVPKVYGSRMRLSTLAVLIALVVGGTLAGVMGAVLILPIVAAYPIIEKIWLRDFLSDEVLEDHENLADAEGAKGKEAVEAVIAGEPDRA